MSGRLDGLGLTLVCALCLAACKAENSEPTLTTNIASQLSSLGERLAILLASRGDQVRWLGYEEPASFWTRTKEDVQEVERSLPAALAQARNSLAGSRGLGTVTATPPLS